MSRHAVAILLAAVLSLPSLPLAAETGAGQAAPAPAQAMGLLKTQCLGCHNTDKSKGGLSLETRGLALKGGDSGPALNAADLLRSPLIQSLSDSGDAHMPPKKQLPEKHINLLKAWAAAGAAWDDAALKRFGELTPAAKLGALPAAHATTGAALALSPDAKRLAVGTGSRVLIRDATKADLPVLATLEAPTQRDVVQSLAWSANGNLLAAGGYRAIHVWSLFQRSSSSSQSTPPLTAAASAQTTPPASAATHSPVAASAQITPARPASSSTTPVLAHLLLYHLTARLEGRITALAFVPETSAASSSTVTASPPKERHLPSAGPAPAATAATPASSSPSEDTAASSALPPSPAPAPNSSSPPPPAPALLIADGPAGGKASLHLWPLGAANPVLTVAEAHTDNILCLALSRDGTQFATGGADNLAKVWSLPSAADSSKDRHLPSASGLPPKDGHLPSAVPAAPPLAPATANSANSANSAASAAAPAFKELARLEGHTGHILALAFSPDGKLLVTTSADKEAKAWDIATKELRLQFGDKSTPITAVHWSQDGKKISFWRDDATAFTNTGFEDYNSLAKDTQRIGEKAGKETKLDVGSASASASPGTDTGAGSSSSAPSPFTAAVGLPDSETLIALQHDGHLLHWDKKQKLTRTSPPPQQSSSSSYSSSSSPKESPSTPTASTPAKSSSSSSSTSTAPTASQASTSPQPPSSPSSNKVASNSQTNSPATPTPPPSAPHPSSPSHTSHPATPPTPAYPTLSYTRDILPILTKAGCNLGSCHAKSSGQAGFRLSIFAFDPRGDYAEVVTDARGRRIFPALPEDSLLLQKATVRIAHEGGQRFEPDSPWAKTIADWIRQGTPYELPGQPTLTRIALSPAEKTYRKNDATALAATAHYSDGTTRDVTALADYISTEKAIASVDEHGHVKTYKESGETVIVARYMGQVAISRVAVPAEKLYPAESYAKLAVRNDIDRHLYARLQKLGHLPSETCTDAEFLRRSTLDAIGLLPTVEEARAFLADTRSDKYERWIDSLLERPEWADHWATKFADLLRPNPSRVGVKPVYLLDQWIRQSLRENKPWDVFVRQLLTAQGSTHQDGRLALWRDKRDPVDAATFVGQIFLGIRLECAKCHHHPTEKWDQIDYYQLAAFFTAMKRKGQGISAPISGEPEYMWAAPGKASIEHPVTKATLAPRPPADKEIPIPETTDPRAVLAGWMTDKANPYFAHAIVNRIWSAYMGRGIVDPVDDFRASNPPTNGPLLDFLARDFTAHGYDLKHLMRTIMRSQAYRLSSEPNETNLTDLKNHSRSYRRRLPAETLLDAVCAVTEVSETFSGTAPGTLAKQNWNQKLTSPFLDAFGRPNSSADCPCERDAKPSIVQALHLMNSTKLQDMLVDKTGRAARLAKSTLPPEQIIEDLYLASYSRLPSEEEKQLSLKAFTAKDATRQTATEDLLWSLLNSAEFVFNH